MNQLTLLLLCLTLYSCSENRKETSIVIADSTINQATIEAKKLQEHEETIQESAITSMDSNTIEPTPDSATTAIKTETLQEFVNKVSYLHASPAMRIEGDIYRFYNGDTLKVEYYKKQKGYAILIGTYKILNDTTLLVNWTRGFKDYNFKEGGQLNSPKQQSLFIKPDPIVAIEMRTVKINGITFWVQGYKNEDNE